MRTVPTYKLMKLPSFNKHISIGRGKKINLNDYMEKLKIFNPYTIYVTAMLIHHGFVYFPFHYEVNRYVRNIKVNLSWLCKLGYLKRLYTEDYEEVKRRIFTQLKAKQIKPIPAPESHLSFHALRIIELLVKEGGYLRMKKIGYSLRTYEVVRGLQEVGFVRKVRGVLILEATPRQVYNALRILHLKRVGRAQYYIAKALIRYLALYKGYTLEEAIREVAPETEGQYLPRRYYRAYIGFLHSIERPSRLSVIQELYQKGYLDEEEVEVIKAYVELV